MTDNTRAVRGPMYIAATPLMVTADVEPLVRANVAELLDLLATEFYDDFREIADAKPTGDHDGHAHERLLAEDLAARLVARMSTKVALTGTQAVRVAGRMHRLGRPLAEEAERREAAIVKATQVLVKVAEQRQGGAAA